MTQLTHTRSFCTDFVVFGRSEKGVALMVPYSLKIRPTLVQAYIAQCELTSGWDGCFAVSCERVLRTEAGVMRLLYIRTTNQPTSTEQCIHNMNELQVSAVHKPITNIRHYMRAWGWIKVFFRGPRHPVLVATSS